MYTYDGDSFQGVSPALHENVYVAKGTQIVGDVRADEWSSFWYNAVARGDVDYISVGKYSNVQDLVCLHVAKGYPCIIGDYVTIGHSAVVHGATVEDHVLIGMGAKILTGAHVGRGSIIAAGALVLENQEIPPNSLVVGVPGRVVRTHDQWDNIHSQAIKYKDEWTVQYNLYPDAPGEKYHGETII